MDAPIKTQDENEARVAEEYLSSLSDLNCNSKPLINMLTMLAEENIGCASVIVKVVEQHIAKVPADIKLPLLYLIDSIVKNVKSTYIHLFSQCIVNIFCDVFEKVNEKIRERMYALRLTWNEVFPSQKLYALDVKVKRIDNNWPITAKQAQPSIHVNPNFLKSVGGVQSGDVEEILQAKTRELLELKKRKLELELEATKKSLEEQDKQLSKVTNGLMPPDSNSMPGLRMPGGNTQMVPPSLVAPGLLAQHHIHPPASHPVIVGGSAVPPGALFHPNFHNPRPQQQQSHTPAGMMPVPPQNFPSINTGNKPRVHPVNPALLNTIRHRDPRLARQQQMQESAPSMRSGVKSSTRHHANAGGGNDMQKSDNKPFSSLNYRNGGGSTKGSRNDGSSFGGGGANSGCTSTESRSPGRHSSSSSITYTGERQRKSSSTRDKEKDRKRSESKSSTTSTSSGGSSSSERQKNASSIVAVSSSSSSRSNKKLAVNKCDKDAFEIAPLSTTFNRKSSTTSMPSGVDALASRKKELKRKSHSIQTSPSHKQRSRSRSPASSNAGTSASFGLDKRSVSSVSPRKQPKCNTTDSEHEEELEKCSNKNITKNVENKTHQPATTVALDNDDVMSTTTTTAAITTTDTMTMRATLKARVAPSAKAEISPVDDECGGGGASGFDGNTIAKRRNSNEMSANTLSEQQPVKPKPPLSPIALEAMDINDIGGDDKKRLSTTISKLEEPLAKKIKSAKFDALFGDEDVDLRTVMPPQMLAAQHHQQKQQRGNNKSPTPPPPPFIKDEQNAESWNNLKISKSTKSTSPSKKMSSLEDVRAKLAKATKCNKFNKAEKFNKDFAQRIKYADSQLNDDSQDANDEKIRTIVAQAQELLESKSINQDQYKNLMQKVMSINETSKLKEAKKRESLGGGASHSKQIDDGEESIEEYRAAAAREAVLKKRIPKLARNATTAEDNEAAAVCAIEFSNTNTVIKSPIYDERSNSNDNVDINVPQRSKPQRERRLKTSKWGEKVDAVGGNANQPKPWPKGAMMRPHQGGSAFCEGPLSNIHPQMPWQMQIPPGIAPGVPFVNPMPMIRSSVPPPPQAPALPIIPLPPNIPKPCNSIDNPQADLVRTITIDGLSKEIRIYDQVAIVFMELDQPREIGFQAGQRSIIIDDDPPLSLQFNDDYKTYSINGQPHRLRFGFPSRELYIDEHWYEIYFGGPPVSIPIQNRIHILKAEGPPPQVNIGALRRDLVVGKINMIVDAHIVIPLFLDAKTQTFNLGQKEHTVQFADNLLTVLLDGEPAKVEYGGLPKSYVLGGISYFIRFGALPQGLKAGQIVIKDMIYVKTEPPATEPIALIAASSAPESPDTSPNSLNPTTDNVVEPSTADKHSDTELSIEPTTKTPESELTGPEVTEPQVVGTAGSGNSAIPIFSATALNKINIDELFQKLVSSGILSGGGSVAAPSNKDAGVLPSPVAVEEEPPQPVAIRPIDLSKSDSIKTRQTAIVDTLFSGMQCSSCGVRFPPEQTIKYSQHLDWHFRQNRRERDLSRKAHSRKWYYDLADWVQYEEIEDLDEREKNFFESQQNDVEASDEASNQKWLNSPVPLSCPALPEDVDRACDMCQEKFEQFYNEDNEEWHLRNAIRIEDKIYHPLCYEDYKAALIAKANESSEKMETNVEEDTNTEDDVIIKIEGDDHSDVEGKTPDSTKNEMDDDDDDVIVLPNEELSVTEIEDDDEYVPESVARIVDKDIVSTGIDNIVEGADAAGSDVEIQEPHIPFTDLDTYVEKEQPGADETSQMSFLNVKIKEEPKDDDEDDDDGFEDVGTVLIPPDEEISIHSSEDTQTQTILSTPGTSPTAERPPSSQSLVQVDATESVEGSSASTAGAPADLNMSIDGNPGTEDEHNLSTVGPLPAIPLASLVNKIKINIAKNSISANSSTTSNNNNNSNNHSGSATLTGTPAATTPYSIVSPSRTPTASETHAGAESESRSGGENHQPYGTVSAICVVSTIPVLCGGGTTGARTTTVASTNSSAKNIADNEESNVSTISVIGSYGSTSSAPRYFPPSTSNTVIPTTTKRQPATPPPAEETITYELKPSLQNIKLIKAKKVQCGVETSGLCSIM